MRTLRLPNMLRRKLAGEDWHCLKVEDVTLTRFDRYPPKPNPGSMKPSEAPTKSPKGEPLFVSDIGTDEAGDTADEALIGGNENIDHVPGFSIPGCGDKYEAGAADQPPDQASDQPPPSTSAPPEDPGESDLPSLKSRHI